MFQLDPRLEQDTFVIGEFELSRVLLMNDARYPWIILVPREVGVTEIFELSEQQQQQLMMESNYVAKQLKALVHADKMNVAALGNVVSQLHIHHVARYIQDESWPAPVWGRGEALTYSQQESGAVIEQLRSSLQGLLLDGL